MNEKNLQWHNPSPSSHEAMRDPAGLVFGVMRFGMDSIYFNRAQTARNLAAALIELADEMEAADEASNEQ